MTVILKRNRNENVDKESHLVKGTMSWSWVMVSGLVVCLEMFHRSFFSSVWWSHWTKNFIIFIFVHRFDAFCFSKNLLRKRRKWILTCWLLTSPGTMTFLNTLPEESIKAVSERSSRKRWDAQCLCLEKQRDLTEKSEEVLANWGEKLSALFCFLIFLRYFLSSQFLLKLPLRNELVKFLSKNTRKKQLAINRFSINLLYFSFLVSPTSEYSANSDFEESTYNLLRCFQI